MTKLEAIFILAQIKNSHETMPKFIKRLNENMAEERIEALDLAIESLSADTEWIPVSERLPKESDDYLCTIPFYEDTNEAIVLTFHDGRFYYDDDEYGWVCYDDVIAWMPLPKPYKGGDDE